MVLYRDQVAIGLVSRKAYRGMGFSTEVRTAERQSTLQTAPCMRIGITGGTKVLDLSCFVLEI